MDLLGFKETVRTKTCAEIVDIFDEAKKEFVISEKIDGVSIPVVPPDDIHYYIMSDSVCIFIREDIKSALTVLSWLCMGFQVRMLCLDSPVLVRGSIIKGEIYEDSNILFGPAMVEAYLREEKLAHVPRVIIPEHLCEEIIDERERALFCGINHLAADGFYVNNYINYFCNHSSTIRYRENVYRYIQNILDTSLDQSVREKYMYVKWWIDYEVHNNAKDT